MHVKEVNGEKYIVKRLRIYNLNAILLDIKSRRTCSMCEEKNSCIPTF
jgi:hypothetical protein